MQGFGIDFAHPFIENSRVCDNIFEPREWKRNDIQISACIIYIHYVKEI